MSTFQPSLDDDGTRLLVEYASDTDSLNDISSVSDTSDDESINSDKDIEYNEKEDMIAPRHLASQYSLGKMVPHPQSTVVPVYDSKQTRTLIINSRDRDLFHEHLLQYSVTFNPPSDALSQTKRIEDKSFVSAYMQRVRLDNDSSYQTFLTKAKQKEFYYSDDGKRHRSCTIIDQFKNVSSVECSQVLFPNYSERIVLRDDDDQDIRVKLGLTLDIDVDIITHKLCSTSHAYNPSFNFSCAPSPTFSSQTQYQQQYMPLTVSTKYDTPIASLEQMTLTYFPPNTCLIADALNPTKSPDIHHVYQIMSHNQTLVVSLTNSPTTSNRLLTGDLVSIRDIGYQQTHNALDENQTKLIHVLCDKVPTLMFVVKHVADKQITLDLSLSGLDHCLPSDDITLDDTIINSAQTLMLNESLQHKLYLNVECIVRRLQQHTVVD